MVQKFPLLLAGIVALLGVAQATNPDDYQIVQGQILIADGIDLNPAGVLANDGGGVDLFAGELAGPGTLEISDDGNFVYTPPPQFFGEVTFSYEATAIGVTELVSGDASWRFRTGASDPTTLDPDFHQTWTSAEFSDNTWGTGSGLMGFGEIGDLVIDTQTGGRNTLTTYFRHTFESASEIGNLVLELIRDDAAIIYLNGVEVARSSDDPDTFDGQPDAFDLAGPIATIEGTIHQHELPVVTIEGTNVLAISMHNQTTNSSDLGLHVLSLSGVEPLERSNALVTITVADAEIAPTVQDDRYLIRAGQVFDSSNVFSLYDNDGVVSSAGFAWDPLLEIVLDGPAADQVAADLQTGHITFTPDPGFIGITTFTYALRDKDGLSQPATVTITTFPGEPGETPIASPDTYSMTQVGLLVTDPLTGVLANDQFATEAAIERPPANGTVTLDPDGSFVFEPNPNFIGTDSFDYSAIRFRRFELLDSSTPWKWLHPLTGIDPESRMEDFRRVWKVASFDDSAWLPGSGLMGYGNITGPEGDLPLDTFIGLPTAGNRRTAYFRSKFSALAGEQTLELELSRDDAAIVSINGEEMVRSIEPDAQSTFRFRTDRYNLMVPAGNGFWTNGELEGVIHKYRFEGVNLLEGANELAISLHNTLSGGAASSSDLGLQVHSATILDPVQSTASVTVEVADGFVRPSTRVDTYVMVVGETLQAVGPLSVFANDGLLDENGIAYDPIINVDHTLPDIGELISFDDTNGEFVFQATVAGFAVFTYQVEDKDGVSVFQTPVRITVRDTEANWRQTNFAPAAGSEITGPLADPDGDGIANRLEYALGLDPNLPTANEIAYIRPLLPDQTRWQLEIFVAYPLPSDITYVVESSSDLQNWTDMVVREAGLNTTWEIPGFSVPSVGFNSFGANQVDGKTLVRLNGSQSEDFSPRYFRLKVL